MAPQKAGLLEQDVPRRRHGPLAVLGHVARAEGALLSHLGHLELGLLKSSTEVLLSQAVKALLIPAETLYGQATLGHEGGGQKVTAAILGDIAITQRQKQVLLELYDSFRQESAARTHPGENTARGAVTVEFTNRPGQTLGPLTSRAEVTQADATTGKCAIVNGHADAT